jgi:hypothetical protein
MTGSQRTLAWILATSRLAYGRRWHRIDHPCWGDLRVRNMRVT